jgi:Tfp pilus assembly protein PilF
MKEEATMLLLMFLCGQLCHTSQLIDIPTAPQYDIPGMFGAGVTFSVPFSTDDPPDPADFTATLRYGFGGHTEVALSLYTLSTYSLSVAHLLARETERSPAFFAGLDDITYSAYVSTIGRGDTVGFIEEKNYATILGGRPAELLSAYVAMQKKLGQYFTMVFGLGRGRFVGYGPRSHVFNTDFFVLGDDYKTEEHSPWAFGVFFGGSIRLPVGLEFIAEMDGRDGNVGVKYHHKLGILTLAIGKAEHFWSPAPYSPRFTAGLEVNNRAMLQKPAMGSIECVIRDGTTDEVLTDATVTIQETNRRYTASNGTFLLELNPGTYTMMVSRTDYTEYVAKITVKPNVKSTLVFNLKRTQAALQREAAEQEREASIRNYMEQGKIYLSEDNLSEAEAAFAIVLSLAPDNEEAVKYLANIELRRIELITEYAQEARARAKSKDYTGAMTYWQKVLDHDPENSEARTELAAIETQMAAPAPKPKPQAPTQVAQKTSGQDVTMLYNKGVSLFTQEKYDEALKIFKQVIAIDPRHLEAQDYKGRTEARLKILRGGG